MLVSKIEYVEDFEDCRMLAKLFKKMLKTDAEGHERLGLDEFRKLVETHDFRSYLQTRGEWPMTDGHGWPLLGELGMEVQADPSQQRICSVMIFCLFTTTTARHMQRPPQCTQQPWKAKRYKDRTMKRDSEIEWNRSQFTLCYSTLRYFALYSSQLYSTL